MTWEEKPAVGSSDAREGNPLVERVDALLRRHRDAAAGRDELPVLTEIVDPEKSREPAAHDAAVVEALARELERAVLQRLEDELQPALAALGQALRVALREAVTGAVERELKARKLDAGALAAKRTAPSGG